MCGAHVMSAEDDFRIRPGRIRSSKAERARPFIAQALAAAQRAGGGSRCSERPSAARRWTDVRWVAKRVWLTKKKYEELFGAAAAFVSEHNEGTAR